MKQIKKFGILQTAKVFGAIYFVITGIIMIPIGLIMSMFGGNDSWSSMPFGGGILFFMLPFCYGIVGFIIVALGCGIYNWITKWTGGIELEVE